MRTLNVELGDRSYPIRIGAGLLSDRAQFAELENRKIKIVTDANAGRRYLPTLLYTLALTPEDVLVLPAGETQKTWTSAEKILDWLLASNFGRDGVLIALGGGVIGDMAGFCAALYQRGIDFVQVPTTLLSQVDSSVGGKTAVNHPRGKNMIGAFHQPKSVIADINTLKTLPPRELASGLAEVIKYGMLADAEFLKWIEQNLDKMLALDAEALTKAIYRSCELKARIVAQDERESGPRALLNLGHTFGHAIETFTGYSEWLHGEAVAVGLCMAADMSTQMGWLSVDDALRCTSLIQRAGLPTRPPVGMTPEDFLELMGHDKKVAAGKVRLVLLRKLGVSVLSADFDEKALLATLKHFTTP
ncbi:3-dehydroquinate synthase [Stenotrophobium rhamnosiphilum]|uniref:3-dehydroquinate synthase n=1 Tax=Stenotrophobium rhamnosiphilum TaxID=2029166 RepID=A0A2T5MFB3_9GAMM|nr:3-dehydroquinate synthase [Stenotrophobium rhamnosiphilum]PTU31271.1 3-dehydroquinate synthase [Stenotrophobium rhamnosiphilum]